MEKKKNVYDEVTRVAYELYQKRGGTHGNHLDDWLEAERTVLQRHAKEIEKEANIIESTRGKKVSDRMEPKTLKTSEGNSRTKTKKSPPKKKT